MRPESGPPEAGELSHVEHGPAGPRSRMVDVAAKPPTDRRAVARCRLRFPPGRLAEVVAGQGPKGPIEEVARAAGFLGAKRTAELLPMCHPLPLDHLELVVEVVEEDVLELRFAARTHGPTGVEMEALTGAAVAALCVYDMTKALDKGIRIEALELLEKSGGKSGDWRRAEGT